MDVGELTIEDREGTSYVRVVFVDRRLDNLYSVCTRTYTSPTYSLKRFAAKSTEAYALLQVETKQ